MKILRGSLTRNLVLCAPAVLFMGAAVNAHATSFTSDAYYIGVEDNPVFGQGTGDKDYNDYVFTLSGGGGGLTLDTLQSATLHAPITPGTSGTPFWNNLSADGAGKNFGNCLYTAPANACTNSGTAINTNAEYVSNGGSAVEFEFSGATAAVSVSFNLNAAIHGDNDTLDWCNSGGCSAITGSSFTPGTGNFWFEVIDHSTGDTYLSTRSDNFAAALDPTSATPEPVSLALTGTGLIGLYFVRRRRTGSR